MDSERDNEFQARCREIFDKFDKDGSGALDRQELVAGLRALGGNPTKNDIQSILEEAENKANANGKLEFDEFFGLLSTYRKDSEQVQEELLNAFMYFDRNQDGSIDKEEVKETLKRAGDDPLTDAEIDEMFAEIDTNDDGKVSYRELVRYMCSQ